METETTQKPRPTRQRAAKACLYCRARKVRCDVVQRGEPCFNCSLDKQECVVKERPAKYRVSKTRTNTQSQSRPNAGVPSPPRPLDGSIKIPTDEARWEGTTEAAPGVSRASPSCSSSSRQDANRNSENPPSDQSVEEMERTIPVPIWAEDKDTNHRAATGCLNSGAFEDNPSELNSQAMVTAGTHVLFSHYSFLELDSLTHMAPEDVNFLERQGCFRVPVRPVLDEFMRQYFLHVHPNLPLINEGGFWEMYSRRDYHPADCSHLSLFVFQAMLFATSGFVSRHTIAKLGFSSIRNARAAYYRRAKLLFDFDGQRSYVATAQGTLLLSYHSPMRNHKRINTFWLSIAIQSAKDAEAHQYHTSQNLTAERRNVLKRLWWCCVLRDRILPLGVRRPLQISSEDFDFSVRPLTVEDLEDEIYRSKVYDAATKRSVVQIIAALCELAVSLTHVIMLVYPLSESPVLYTNTGEVFFQQYLSQIDLCKLGLDRWYQRTTISFPAPAGARDAHKSLTMFTNLLYIYYHSAKAALINHETLVSVTHSLLSGSRWRPPAQTKSQLEDAMAGITDNLKEIIQLKMTKYMPISAVAYAALPLVLHVLDVKLSSSDSQTAMKQQRLDIYKEAMKWWQSQYDGTDKVSDIIVKMIDHVRLDGSPQISHAGPDRNRHTQRNHFFDCGSSSSTSKSSSNLATISDWGDIFLRQQACYLQLVQTIDLSLSKGEFPANADFPLALQSRSRSEPLFPLFRIAMSEVDDADDSDLEDANMARHQDSHTSMHPVDVRMNSNLGGTSYSAGATVGPPHSAVDGVARLSSSIRLPNTHDISLLRDLDMPVDFAACATGPDDPGDMEFDYSAAASWPGTMFLGAT